ncbi:MAG TPA: M28 family peptidase [Thermomicrobiales bacterium]|nr:M28 family peptidase [Thermomicrobiales bacterium]
MAEATRAIERRVLGDVWTSDEIYRNLLHLCDDLGARFGGSASEHAAADFLLGKMREYGLHGAHVEEFPVYTWERGSCDLALVAPVARTVSAIAMPFAGSGIFEGELVDVGEGEAADFARAGDAVRGKFVLSAAETNRPGEQTLHRTDKYRLAVEAGATGYVFVNKNPGLLHITGALYARTPGGAADADHEAPIPAVGVSHEGGALLRRLAARGTPRVRLHLKNRTYRSHSANVVGDIPGQHPEEVVLIGGHYDGHDVAQGAADDAAGTLVGLEAGRVLAPCAGQLRRTVRIICYGYEELGLGGSWAHAERYTAPDADRLACMVNLDGAGRGGGGQEQVTATGDPAFAAYFKDLAKRLRYDFGVRDRIGAHSDHFPFFLAGFPSAGLSSRDAIAGMIGRGYGHTEGDTVDKVTLRGLQMGAALAARVALDLATVEPFPVGRRGADEVRAALEQAGLGRYVEHHWGRANRVDGRR